MTGAAAIVSGTSPLVAIPDLNYLLSQVVNGLVLGMILVLISLGLSLIFGIMGVINFAHGDLLLVGTYVTWTATTATGSMLVGVVAGTVAAAVVGLGMERLALRYSYDYDETFQLLLTFGIAELLRGIVQFVWGRVGKSFPTPDLLAGTADFGLFTFPRYRLFVVGVASVIIVVTYLFLNRTDVGLIIRAGTQNRQMVDALGIDISRIFLYVFGIGAALAGVSGALVGPIFGVYPTLGIDLLIQAFVVVVIGGIGSFRGSIVAGLLVGEVSVLTGVVYSPASRIVIFLAMAVILLVRPRGLFGTKGAGS